jgi:hypothetical protein
MSGASDLLVKDAAALTRTLPLYGASYSVVKQGWLAASLLTGKDFFSLQGSATKVVRLKRVKFLLVSDLAHAGNFSLELVRESTSPSTSGTFVPITPAPYDTVNPPATAVATLWPVTQTNGTGSVLLAIGEAAVANIAPTSTAGSGNIVGEVNFDFTQHGDEAPTLRGIADFFTLRCVGGAPTSTTADLWVQFEESDA